MPSLPIEEPEEATSPEMDVAPPFAPPIQEPEVDEKSLPVVETTPIDEGTAPIVPPPIAAPLLPPPAPAPSSSPGIHTGDVRPQSGSRGLLFALLALAVIGGLIAFFFVSK
jgi:hypothetical protein